MNVVYVKLFVAMILSKKPAFETIKDAG